MNVVEHGLDVIAEATVTYGAFRRQVAEWAGKDPAHLTAEDIRAYEAVQEGK